MTSAGAQPRGAISPADAQRIDKWLWCARLFKTRSLAAKVVASGSVRLTRNGETLRVAKASLSVRIGDQLGLMIGERLRIVEVLACADRRGPAPQARQLYADHSPAPGKPAPPALAARAKGAGRPTKKDRRAIARLAETT